MPNKQFTFSRDDIFGDEIIAQSSHQKSEVGAQKTMGRLQYRGYRDRKETEALIKSVLEEAGRPLKFREVARGVDRSPSPFLRSILVEMIDRGEVLEAVDVSPNERLPRYWYSLAKNSRS